MNPCPVLLRANCMILFASVLRLSTENVMIIQHILFSAFQKSPNCFTYRINKKKRWWRKCVSWCTWHRYGTIWTNQTTTKKADVAVVIHPCTLWTRTWMTSFFPKESGSSRITLLVDNKPPLHLCTTSCSLLSCHFRIYEVIYAKRKRLFMCRVLSLIFWICMIKAPF